MKTLIFLGCKDYHRMRKRVSEYAPLINLRDDVIVSGTPMEAEYLLTLLVDYGIMPNKIRVERYSHDTLTNMLFSFDMVKTKDVLICTDKLHIGRATLLAIFVNNVVRDGEFKILNKHKVLTKYRKGQFKRFYLNTRRRNLWFY